MTEYREKCNNPMSNVRKNRFTDMWLSMPRGQRRATIALLFVIVLLAVAQVVVSTTRHHRQEVTPDYSLLEDEISYFRTQIDSLPVDERRPTYWRRTHAGPDSSVAAQRATQRAKEHMRKGEYSRKLSTPRIIEPVPRIEEQE